MRHMNRDTITIKLCIGIVLAAIGFRLLFVPFLVKGQSMEPTLHNNNIGLSVKTTIKDIKRFDIVLIDIPTDNKYIIKRIIGLPGEQVAYSNNQLYINGEPMKDPYNLTFTSDFSVQLSENEYFALGDNRTNSSDSRVYGPFNIQDIISVKW